MFECEVYILEVFSKNKHSNQIPKYFKEGMLNYPQGTASARAATPSIAVAVALPFPPVTALNPLPIPVLSRACTHNPFPSEEALRSHILLLARMLGHIDAAIRAEKDFKHRQERIRNLCARRKRIEDELVDATLSRPRCATPMSAVAASLAVPVRRGMKRELKGLKVSAGYMSSSSSK